MKVMTKIALQAVAIGAFALIATGLASRPAMAAEPPSCDQQYTYCVGDAASSFQCCMYETDISLTVPYCEMRPALAKNSKLTPVICGSQLSSAIGGCAFQYGLCIAHPTTAK